MMMTSFKATILGACALLMAGAASAATLTSRPSTVLYEGSALYVFDLDIGFGSADGPTSVDEYLFFITGSFDALTPDDIPTGVNVLVADSLFDEVISSEVLEEFESGIGFLAFLFGDLEGPAASAFTGGKMLVILRDPNFPALSGSATFELRRLDPATVIPLPAAAPLMLAGLGALAFVARRRKA